MKKQTGDAGESQACDYLKKKGYTICQRNFRGRFGEVDIIAEKGNTLIFVEVKTRRTTGFGQGFEAVTRDKQQKLLKTAELYIVQKKHIGPARFDVISIDNGVVTHIENAFS